MLSCSKGSRGLFVGIPFCAGGRSRGGAVRSPQQTAEPGGTPAGLQRGGYVPWNVPGCDDGHHIWRNGESGAGTFAGNAGGYGHWRLPGKAAQASKLRCFSVN